ncbi:MAG TPA: hypothetical protein DHW63_05820 [Hyphomonadaceae bacterium]|nr:hypothetical protein [Hyphomonadaceae bacterium]
MSAAEGKTSAPAPVEAGLIGLIAASFVGIGEFCLQFSPHGGYEDQTYAFFLGVGRAQLDLGYALTVFAAPLYLVGYWHLKTMLAPASRLAAWAFFLIGAYAFVIGAVWIGQRPLMALTAQAIAAGGAAPALLEEFAARNEVLVSVLRAAVAITSLIWIALILGGRTLYPRWMALLAPGILLAAVFALYAFAPAIGVYVVPTAMNAAHLVVFAFSSAVAVANTTRR